MSAAKKQRCQLESGAYTSASGHAPPLCVMCGEPVTAGQSSSSWSAPNDPQANVFGRVWRHAQDSANGVPCFRFDRKWGHARKAAA